MHLFRFEKKDALHIIINHYDKNSYQSLNDYTEMRQSSSYFHVLVTVLQSLTKIKQIKTKIHKIHIDDHSYI